jgi:UDP-glucose 6-dehydrogenase
LGIDYQNIVSVLQYDDRIGKMMQVPGYDGDRGAGGKCLPKDINALIYLAREHGYRPDLLEEIWRTNLKFRKKIDWL